VTTVRPTSLHQPERRLPSARLPTGTRSGDAAVATGCRHWEAPTHLHGSSRPEVIALLVIVVVGVAVLALVALTPTGAGAGPTGDQPEATTTSTPAGADPDIIPRPDSGRAPDEAGDRGGALQLGLLALIVVAVAFAVAMLVRESRRARARSR
jgi:hypothetical protein